MTRTNRVQVISSLRAGSPAHTYYVTQAQADVLVARGDGNWAEDGTRRIYTKVARAASVNASARVWRKVTARTKNGGIEYSTMQLVPGVQGGYNSSRYKGR